MNYRSAFLACILSAFLIFVISCRPSPSPAGLSPTDPVTAFPEPAIYDLKIDVDYESGLISGDCALTIKNAGDQPVPVVPLNLYRLMEVSSVTDDKGTALEFSQNVRIFEDWREFQVNHIRILLDPPLPPGKESTLRILYGGPLLGYAEAMRYVKDHVSPEFTIIRTDSRVYPAIGVTSWATNRALGLKDYEYTVSLTVPSTQIVANAGILVSKDEKDGRTTWIYEDRVPSWRIDLAVSNYDMVEGNEGRFRIFAFPEDIEGARELLSALTATLELYTRWFGPLKVFPGLTVIEVPDGYGSQADVAAVIQEANAFKDKSGHFTFYHELSHLWNVKGMDPQPPRFESEGLAMLLQHLVQERLEGQSGSVREAVGTSISRMAKYFSEHPDAKTTPMIRYGEEDLTDLSYRMGQIFYFLLYQVLGEDTFMETVGSFYQKYFNTGATAAHFVEHVKAESEADLDRLFEEWIFTAKAAELLSAGTTLEEFISRYR